MDATPRLPNQFSIRGQDFDDLRGYFVAYLQVSACLGKKAFHFLQKESVKQRRCKTQVRFQIDYSAH